MESGSIKASGFSMGYTGKTLDGMYSLTGGSIEVDSEGTYFNTIRIDGLEEDKIREIIGLFRDKSGQPLQPDIHENDTYGGYYAFAKGDNSDGHATYAIFEETGNAVSGGTAFADVGADAYYAAPGTGRWRKISPAAPAIPRSLLTIPAPKRRSSRSCGGQPALRSRKILPRSRMWRQTPIMPKRLHGLLKTAWQKAVPLSRKLRVPD